MLITLKFAFIDDFTRFLRRIQQQRRLNRVVIDECHIVLNDQLEYWLFVQQLDQLH